MTWKPDVVLYHGGCDDGFGAAFAAWKRWGSESVEYIPCHYGMPNPAHMLRDKNVLMVDFSFKYPDMRILGEHVKSMVVLDHHKTAKAELHEWGASISPRTLADKLEGTEFEIGHVLMQNCLPIIAWFDMEKSGARMAWEFCHPGTEVPIFILLIEDRDLWRFRNGDMTRQLSAALRTYPQDFGVWEYFAVNPCGLVEEGKAILRGHQKNVDGFCRNAYWTDIGGYKVPVVNVPYHYASDCAHELLQRFPEAPFAAAWFRRGDNRVQWSLRSEDSRVDVSEVAKQAGGGGHRNASGFEVAA